MMPKVPFTRHNLLYRVYKHSSGCKTRLTTGLTTGCIVYTAGCQTGCTTRLNEHLLVQHGCQTGFDNRLNEQWLFVRSCQTGLTAGWMFVYTIQPIVKPAVQRV